MSSYAIYSYVKVKNEEELNWSNADKMFLTKQCIDEAGENAEKFSDFTKEYCECSTEKITKALNKKKYIEKNELPIDQKMKEIFPLFESCLNEYNLKIETYVKDIIKKENKNPPRKT